MSDSHLLLSFETGIEFVFCLISGQEQKDASSEVFPELRASSSSMFLPKSGLSEFYIWDDDFEKNRIWRMKR